MTSNEAFEKWWNQPNTSGAGMCDIWQAAVAWCKEEAAKKCDDLEVKACRYSMQYPYRTAALECAKVIREMG